MPFCSKIVHNCLCAVIRKLKIIGRLSDIISMSIDLDFKCRIIFHQLYNIIQFHLDSGFRLKLLKSKKIFFSTIDRIWLQSVAKGYQYYRLNPAAFLSVKNFLKKTNILSGLH